MRQAQPWPCPCWFRIHDRAGLWRVGTRSGLWVSRLVTAVISRYPCERLCLGVILSVLGDELLFVCRNLIDNKDRVGRTNRHASAAIDAAIGVHVKLGRCFELLFVLLRVDAVGRTGFDAEFIFGTGVGDDVCNDYGLPFFVLSPHIQRAGG
jgi:hypothetical protein